MALGKTGRKGENRG